VSHDPYDVLGVDRDASQREIQAAYRRLARGLHPDVNADPSAEERFREVTEAYGALSARRATPPGRGAGRPVRVRVEPDRGSLERSGARRRAGDQQRTRDRPR